MTSEQITLECAQIGLEAEREKNRNSFKTLGAGLVALLLVPWRIWALLLVVGTLRPLIEALASWLLRH